MKKIISICAILFVMTSASFARIVFQGSMAAIGQTTMEELILNDSSADINFETSFDDFGNVEAGVAWEFATDSDIFVHYFLGLNTGFTDIGMSTSMVNGLNFRSLDLGFLRTEFSLSCDLGISSDLGSNVGVFTKFNADVVFMGQRRTGLFFGVGYTSMLIPVFGFYNFEELSLGVFSYGGIRFLAGLRI